MMDSKNYNYGTLHSIQLSLLVKVKLKYEVYQGLYEGLLGWALCCCGTPARAEPIIRTKLSDSPALQ